MDFSFPKLEFHMPKMPSFGDFEKNMQNHMKEMKSHMPTGGNNDQYESSSFYDSESENRNGKHQEHKEMSSQKTECHNGVCKTVKCHNGKCDIVGEKNKNDQKEDALPEPQPK